MVGGKVEKNWFVGSSCLIRGFEIVSKTSQIRAIATVLVSLYRCTSRSIYSLIRLSEDANPTYYIHVLPPGYDGYGIEDRQGSNPA